MERSVDKRVIAQPKQHVLALFRPLGYDRSVCRPWPSSFLRVMGGCWGLHQFSEGQERRAGKMVTDPEIAGYKNTPQKALYKMTVLLF